MGISVKGHEFIPLSINVPQPIYLLSINIPFSFKVHYFKSIFLSMSNFVKICKLHLSKHLLHNILSFTWCCCSGSLVVHFCESRWNTIGRKNADQLAVTLLQMSVSITCWLSTTVLDDLREVNYGPAMHVCAFAVYQTEMNYSVFCYCNHYCNQRLLIGKNLLSLFWSTQKPQNSPECITH